MRRILILTFMVALAGCASAARTGPAEGGASSPGPDTTAKSASPSPSVTPSESQKGSAPAPPNIGPAGGSGAATALRGESTCSQDTIALPIAQLRWAPAVERGDEQLVQVTIYSFDLPGSVFSAPLESAIDELVFDQLSGQAVHMWRVLTRHGDTWTPSESGEFIGATCVADG